MRRYVLVLIIVLAMVAQLALAVPAYAQDEPISAERCAAGGGMVFSITIQGTSSTRCVGGSADGKEVDPRSIPAGP
jgi:hypothetical protein